MHMCGWNLPLVSSPQYAVDLFMMISGFIMVYQYNTLKDQKRPTKWTDFWIRRFFRIAPVYYFAILILFIFGSSLASWAAIAKDLPAIKLQGYTDFSWDNVLMHLTFLFGLTHKYNDGFPLPDWSLSLEMQFYALFPLIVLSFAKLGALRTVILFVLPCVILAELFPEYKEGFALPSFLLYKINIFITGMLLGIAYTDNTVRKEAYILGGLALSAFTFFADFGIPSSLMRMALFGGFAVLALKNIDALPVWAAKALNLPDRILSSRLGYYMGELSYSVYLLHILVLIPVGGYIISHYKTALEPMQITLTVLIIAIPVVYLLSWVTYLAIEKPGIRLGRFIIKARTVKDSA